MKEPETLPLILGVIGFALFLLAIAAVADRKTKRRPNKRIGHGAPRPDPRNWSAAYMDSIKQERT
jgi:hypothetical protein